MNISVVMTTYNGCEYLKEQLDSIRNQSLQPDEVIIVDDCSSDNTIELLDLYVHKYNLTNWRVIKNSENIGWKINFIKAMDMANGEIVFLADQDDIWFRGKIEHMYSSMKQNQAIGVLASQVHRFHKAKDIVEGDIVLHTERIRRIPAKETNIVIKRPGCAICYNNSFYHEVRKGIMMGWPHDAYLWLSAIVTDKLYVLEQEELNYRRHEGAVTKGKDFSIENRLERNKAAINQIELLIEKKIAKDKNEIVLNNYLEVLKLRQKALTNRNFFKLWEIFWNTNYYPSSKTFLGDVLSILRN